MASLLDVINSALDTAHAERWVKDSEGEALGLHIARYLLDATGGPDHIVRIKGAAWTIQHPLDERFEAGPRGLFNCECTKEVSAEAHNFGDGEWRVIALGPVWGWERAA